METIVFYKPDDNFFNALLPSLKAVFCTPKYRIIKADEKILTNLVRQCVSHSPPKALFNVIVADAMGTRTPASPVVEACNILNKGKLPFGIPVIMLAQDYVNTSYALKYLSDVKSPVSKAYRPDVWPMITSSGNGYCPWLLYLIEHGLKCFSAEDTKRSIRKSNAILKEFGQNAKGFILHTEIDFISNITPKQMEAFQRFDHSHPLEAYYLRRILIAEAEKILLERFNRIPMNVEGGLSLLFPLPTSTYGTAQSWWSVFQALLDIQDAADRFNETFDKSNLNRYLFNKEKLAFRFRVGITSGQCCIVESTPGPKHTGEAVLSGRELAGHCETGLALADIPSCPYNDFQEPVFKSNGKDVKLCFDPYTIPNTSRKDILISKK